MLKDGGTFAHILIAAGGSVVEEEAKALGEELSPSSPAAH
jgi:hypothetical protein